MSPTTAVLTWFCFVKNNSNPKHIPSKARHNVIKSPRSVVNTPSFADTPFNSIQKSTLMLLLLLEVVPQLRL